MFFALLFRGLILHRCSIDFASISGWIFHWFFIIYAYRHRSATKPREPCFWTTVWCSALKNKFLPFQKNMFFHDFHGLLCYHFLHWILMSFGIDFGSILWACLYNFLYFFVTEFSMNLRWHLLWILDQNGSPKTTPGGSKNSIPLVGFWFASSLATLALKGVLQNLILATRALKRVLQNVILDVVSCIFFPNLFAGRQHRGDTENMDETIQQPRTKGSTLATQHTQTCHPRHLGGVFKAGGGGEVNLPPGSEG